jgi:uncharacterized membrane protein YgcG
VWNHLSVTISSGEQFRIFHSQLRQVSFVINPMLVCSSYAPSNANSTTDPIITREKQKMAKYEQAAIDNQSVFIPFVMDSLGRFGEGAMRLIDIIIDHYSTCNPLDSISSINNLRSSIITSLSFQLQAGNGGVDVAAVNKLVPRKPIHHPSLLLPAAEPHPIHHNTLVRPPAPPHHLPSFSSGSFSLSAGDGKRSADDGVSSSGSSFSGGDGGGSGGSGGGESKEEKKGEESIRKTPTTARINEALQSSSNQNINLAHSATSIHPPSSSSSLSSSSGISSSSTFPLLPHFNHFIVPAALIASAIRPP